MIEELRKYYECKLTACKNYLDGQLSQFKDDSQRYLSKEIENYCEQAAISLNHSNQKAFSDFYEMMLNIEQMAKDGYPLSLIKRLAESTKSTLERSLKMNQTVFDDSVSYYKQLLKR